MQLSRYEQVKDIYVKMFIKSSITTWIKLIFNQIIYIYIYIYTQYFTEDLYIY
jgi:hypothetical protein